jgi:hypothetical protein
MKPNVKRAYTGRSGQLAVMAELLARARNVAIPEIDVGEDLFTFQDGQMPIDRIQVKTANAKRTGTKGGYSAVISVPLAQLRALDTPALHYVFPIRLDDQWSDYVVVSRSDLNLRHESDQIGNEDEKKGELRFHFKFDSNSMTCKECDLSEFRNAWDRLPILGT